MSVNPPDDDQTHDPAHGYGSVPSAGQRRVGQEPSSEADIGEEHKAASSDDETPAPPNNQFGSTADPAPAKLSGQTFFDYVFSDRMADWLLVYVGQNADGFAKTYQRMRKAGRTQIISWSTPAFFLTFAWFFYRRMWLMGMLFLALPAVVFQIAPDLGNGVLLGMPFVAGLSAKTLYLNQAFRAIYRVDRRPLSPRQKHEAIRDRGGVAYLAGLLGFVIVMMIWGMALLAFSGALTPVMFEELMQKMPYGRSGSSL